MIDKKYRIYRDTVSLTLFVWWWNGMEYGDITIWIRCSRGKNMEYSLEEEVQSIFLNKLTLLVKQFPHNMPK